MAKPREAKLFTRFESMRGSHLNPESIRGTALLLFLGLDFRNLFPVLQFSFERLDERISKSIENSRDNVRRRMLERTGKRNLRSKTVFRIIAHDLGQRAED